MAFEPPEQGTLVVACMLLLALGFAGYWISTYAARGGPPWELLPWFVAAEASLGVLGILAALRRGRRKSDG